MMDTGGSVRIGPLARRRLLELRAARGAAHTDTSIANEAIGLLWRIAVKGERLSDDLQRFIASDYKQQEKDDDR